MTLRKQVEIVYVDKQGRTANRTIEPVEGGIAFNYGSESLPEWLITARDISGDGTLKTFSAQRIKSWRAIT